MSQNEKLIIHDSEGNELFKAGFAELLYRPYDKDVPQEKTLRGYLNKFQFMIPIWERYDKACADRTLTSIYPFVPELRPLSDTLLQYAEERIDVGLIMEAQGIKTYIAGTVPKIDAETSQKYLTVKIVELQDVRVEDSVKAVSFVYERVVSREERNFTLSDEGNVIRESFTKKHDGKETWEYDELGRLSHFECTNAEIGEGILSSTVIYKERDGIPIYELEYTKENPDDESNPKRFYVTYEDILQGAYAAEDVWYAGQLWPSYNFNKDENGNISVTQGIEFPYALGKRVERILLEEDFNGTKPPIDKAHLLEYYKIYLDAYYLGLKKKEERGQASFSLADLESLYLSEEASEIETTIFEATREQKIGIQAVEFYHRLRQLADRADVHMSLRPAALTVFYDSGSLKQAEMDFRLHEVSDDSISSYQILLMQGFTAEAIQRGIFTLKEIDEEGTLNMINFSLTETGIFALKPLGLQTPGEETTLSTDQLELVNSIADLTALAGQIEVLFGTPQIFFEKVRKNVYIFDPDGIDKIDTGLATRGIPALFKDNHGSNGLSAYMENVITSPEVQQTIDAMKQCLKQGNAYIPESKGLL